MPTFRVTDNTSGRTFDIQGDTAPTDAEIEELMSSIPTPAPVQAFPEVPSVDSIPEAGPPGQQPREAPFLTIPDSALDVGGFVKDIAGIPDAIRQGIGTGAAKAIGGLGELTAGIGEKTGLFPEGQAARVAGGTSALIDKVKELEPAESAFAAPFAQGAEALTQAAPFLAAGPGATAAKTVLKAGALGGAAGGTSFIEDPEQAGLSLERGLRTGTGTLFGLALSGAMAAVGGIKSGVGKKDVPRQETVRLGRRDLQFAQESQKAGIPVTPGAAKDSTTLLAKEGRVFGSEAKKFAAEAGVKRGRKAATSLTEEFLDSVLPERRNIPAVRQQVSGLYEKAKPETFSLETLDTALKDKGVDGTFKAIMKQYTASLKTNPVRANELKQFKPNQIAWLDDVKKFMDHQVALKDKAPAFNKMGIESVRAVRSAMLEVADTASPAYASARNLASRNMIIQNLEKRLGAKAVAEGGTVPGIGDVSPMDFFKSTLKNKKQIQELFQDLRTIKNPEQRTLALQKARQLRRVLSRWERTEPLLTRVSRGDKPIFQERVSEKGAVFFTVKRFMEQGKSDAIIDFMLSDRWATDILAKPLRATTPAQFNAQLGNAINLITSKLEGPQQDQAGALNFEEQEPPQ